MIQFRTIRFTMQYKTSRLEGRTGRNSRNTDCVEKEEFRDISFVELFKMEKHVRRSMWNILQPLN
jgi:hypothetical protein